MSNRNPAAENARNQGLAGVWTLVLKRCRERGTLLTDMTNLSEKGISLPGLPTVHGVYYLTEPAAVLFVTKTAFEGKEYNCYLTAAEIPCGLKLACLLTVPGSGKVFVTITKIADFLEAALGLLDIKSGDLRVTGLFVPHHGSTGRRIPAHFYLSLLIP